MITLVFPAANRVVYAVIDQTLYGPLGIAMDEAGSCELTVPWRGRGLSQGKSMYHENEVYHEDATGTFWYDPDLDVMRPMPTPQCPDQLMVPTIDDSGNLGTMRAELGFARHGTVALCYDDEQLTMIRQRTWFRESSSSWTWYEVTAYKSSPTVVTGVSKCVLTFDGDAGKFYRTFYSSPAAWSSHTEFDWTMRQNAGSIRSMWLQARPEGDPAGVSADGWAWTRKVNNPHRTLLLDSMRETINMFVAHMKLQTDFLEVVDYGLLADEAAKKVRGNNVNMLAFLRDLRHPTEMIPKLRNLKKLSSIPKSLRNASSDYLAVHYGILPTVSDLRSIYKAITRLKPYVDRNGYNTYSAGHASTAVVGDYSYRLEQHLKLAIDDEDNLFDQIIQTVDDVGMLPTLENLWDLIPYSFVIDWFVNVSDLLERVDTRSRLARYNIRYVTMSYKVSASTQLWASTGNSLTGTVTRAYYHRWTSDQCPMPPLSLTPNTSDSSHWLESGALILQRL